MGGNWEEKRRGKGKRGEGSGMGGVRGDVERVRKFEQRCLEMGNGKLELATSKSQMPRKQDAPRTQ